MPSLGRLSSSNGAKGKGNKETPRNVWGAGDVPCLGCADGLIGMKMHPNTLDMCSVLSHSFTPLELSKK